MNCPKCGRVAKDGAEACVRCGLIFARWSPDAASEVPQLDARAAELWACVTASEEAWRDEAAHDAFIKYCSAAGLLAPAGRHYRARLDADPKDAVAARFQQRIVTMATAAMQPVGRVPKEPFTRSRWFWIAIGTCVVLGAVAGFGAPWLLGRK